MSLYKIIAPFILMFITLSAWSQKHTMYLVGDAGEPFENGNPVMKQVQDHFIKDSAPGSMFSNPDINGVT